MGFAIDLYARTTPGFEARVAALQIEDALVHAGEALEPLVVRLDVDRPHVARAHLQKVRDEVPADETARATNDDFAFDEVHGRGTYLASDCLDKTAPFTRRGCDASQGAREKHWLL